MRIGLVVHSDTGNTLSVVEKLQSKLVAAGHEAHVEKLLAAGNSKPGDMNSEPASLPDLTNYEGLVFAAPVHAFSLSALMRKTLTQIQGMQGKPTGLLVTQAFPFAWLGGNRAMRQMTGVLKEKGAVIAGTEIVNWMGSGLEERITLTTDALAKVF